MRRDKRGRVSRRRAGFNHRFQVDSNSGKVVPFWLQLTQQSAYANENQVDDGDHDGELDESDGK
jgi:hypothetical protein